MPPSPQVGGLLGFPVLADLRVKSFLCCDGRLEKSKKMVVLNLGGIGLDFPCSLSAFSLSDFFLDVGSYASFSFENRVLFFVLSLGNFE